MAFLRMVKFCSLPLALAAIIKSTIPLINWRGSMPKERKSSKNRIFFANSDKNMDLVSLDALLADIIDLLVQHLDEYSKAQVQPILQYSQQLTRIQPQIDKMELEFASGHQDVVALVIGADGIHSYVAKMLNIEDNPPIYSGANIFYGKIPNPDNLEYFQNHPIFRGRSLVNGPGTGEFIAFKVGSGDNKTFIWANTYASASPPKQQGSDDEEWSNQGNAQELEKSILPKFPKGHPIHDFAKMTMETGRPDDLLHFGLFNRQHKSTWTDGGRVVLLGDSCHATLPYVGQGANQEAIEDAIVLAESLEKHEDYAKAYQEYYDRAFLERNSLLKLCTSCIIPRAGSCTRRWTTF